MSRLPTPGHLVSRAKLSPRTIQSVASSRSGRTGKGNPYLKAVLGEAAATAARTGTFPGELGPPGVSGDSVFCYTRPLPHEALGPLRRVRTTMVR
jgi:Transposase IS116/IS110/IS902 family